MGADHMTKNGKEMIDHLSRLWACYVNNVFIPRSTGHDLLATCLAYIFSKSPNLIEYGPFIGHSSFYLVSMASFRGGDSYLVDDWRQLTAGRMISPDAARKMLHANVGSIATNRYELVDRNVLENPILDVDAGFIFYDICTGRESAIAARNMIEHRASVGKDTIVVVDDVVAKHESNEQFLETWMEEYPGLSGKFNPFLVTKNRLFMSNFAMDSSFGDLVNTLVMLGWLHVVEEKHETYGLPVYGASSEKKGLGKIGWTSMALILEDPPTSV
jgi:hypothetical protein